MGHQQESVRESFELALLRDDDFPKLFYEILFERHPETRKMFFRNTLNAQREMLAKTLMAVVDHLHDADWLTTNLAPLGASHVEYGVTTEMYDWVGDALISAVAQVCAADWTPVHEDAWRVAYARIAAIMLKGAEAAPT